MRRWLCAYWSFTGSIASRSMSPLPARSMITVAEGAFLGAGPNAASAKLGATKLFEGAQQIALSTNIEEWAHDQYFISRVGEPVILVAPSGAAFDRATEILSELNYIDAAPIFVGDLKPTEPAVHLPLAADLSEELTPVLASISLSQVGLHLMRLNGRRSYNFPTRRRHGSTTTPSIASRLANRRELARAARGERSS